MGRVSGRVLLGTGIALGFFIIDRIGKWLAVHELSPDGLFLFPGIAGITLRENSGIAYGIAIPPTILMSLVIGLIIFCVGAAVACHHRGSIRPLIPLMLIVAGACSNLLDRFVYGAVVDWLVLTSWPVFNIADAMIAAGAVWLGILIVRQKKTHGY
ncbi:MAG: signal peptidase II [Patescibacteria group bacterium]